MGAALLLRLYQAIGWYSGQNCSGCTLRGMRQWQGIGMPRPRFRPRNQANYPGQNCSGCTLRGMRQRQGIGMLRLRFALETRLITLLDDDR